MNTYRDLALDVNGLGMAYVETVESLKEEYMGFGGEGQETECSALDKLKKCYKIMVQKGNLPIKLP